MFKRFLTTCAGTLLATLLLCPPVHAHAIEQAIPIFYVLLLIIGVIPCGLIRHRYFARKMRLSSRALKAKVAGLSALDVLVWSPLYWGGIVGSFLALFIGFPLLWYFNGAMIAQTYVAHKREISRLQLLLLALGLALLVPMFVFVGILFIFIIFYGTAIVRR